MDEEKLYTLSEARLILSNRALKKTIAILRDQLSEMRSAFLDIQEVIRNNDKDAEIKRLNIVIDELIKKGFAYNQQQWSELVDRIQKEQQ